MHAAIWEFVGDPADLLPRYDAMLAQIPRSNMRLHLCRRRRAGIMLVDTCPDQETFETFALGEEFRSLRQTHGLPEAERLEDLPVHAAFVDGRRRDR